MIDSKNVFGVSTTVSTSSTIGKYCIIEDNVDISENVVIGDYTTILSNTKIGRNTEIGAHCIIGCLPEGMKRKIQSRYTTIIGCNNKIRDFVKISCASLDNQSTYIGDSNYIAQNVYIGHDCKINNYVRMHANVTMSGKSTIDDYAVVGTSAFIHQNTAIGSFAMIGAMSKITHDIFPYVLADGNPAVIKKLNEVGLKRNGFTQKEISDILQMYYELIDYETGCVDIHKAVMLKKQYLHKRFLEEIIDFMNRSKRGCCYFKIKDQQLK